MQEPRKRWIGESGIEILVDVIEETTGRAPETSPECRFFTAKEHYRRIVPVVL